MHYPQTAYQPMPAMQHRNHGPQHFPHLQSQGGFMPPQQMMMGLPEAQQTPPSIQMQMQQQQQQHPQEPQQQQHQQPPPQQPSYLSPYQYTPPLVMQSAVSPHHLQVHAQLPFRGHALPQSHQAQQTPPQPQHQMPYAPLSPPRAVHFPSHEHPLGPGAPLLEEQQSQGEGDTGQVPSGKDDHQVTAPPPAKAIDFQGLRKIRAWKKRRQQERERARQQQPQRALQHQSELQQEQGQQRGDLQESRVERDAGHTNGGDSSRDPEPQQYQRVRERGRGRERDRGRELEREREQQELEQPLYGDSHAPPQASQGYSAPTNGQDVTHLQHSGPTQTGSAEDLQLLRAQLAEQEHQLERKQEAFRRKVSRARERIQAERHAVDTEREQAVQLLTRVVAGGRRFNRHEVAASISALRASASSSAAAQGAHGPRDGTATGAHQRQPWRAVTARSPPRQRMNFSIAPPEPPRFLAANNTDAQDGNVDGGAHPPAGIAVAEAVTGAERAVVGRGDGGDGEGFGPGDEDGIAEGEHEALSGQQVENVMHADIIEVLHRAWDLMEERERNLERRSAELQEREAAVARREQQLAKIVHLMSSQRASENFESHQLVRQPSTTSELTADDVVRGDANGSRNSSSGGGVGGANASPNASQDQAGRRPFRLSEPPPQVPLAPEGYSHPDDQPSMPFHGVGVGVGVAHIPASGVMPPPHTPPPSSALEADNDLTPPMDLPMDTGDPAGAVSLTQQPQPQPQPHDHYTS